VRTRALHAFAQTNDAFLFPDVGLKYIQLLAKPEYFGLVAQGLAGRLEGAMLSSEDQRVLFETLLEKTKSRANSAEDRKALLVVRLICVFFLHLRCI
jgi:hypothetical protein